MRQTALASGPRPSLAALNTTPHVLSTAGAGLWRSSAFPALCLCFHSPRTPSSTGKSGPGCSQGLRGGRSHRLPCLGAGFRAWPQSVAGYTMPLCPSRLTILHCNQAAG